MTEPRNDLAQIDRDDLAQVLAPLSWDLIEMHMRDLDARAPGGVSPSATIIGSLAVRLYHAHRPRLQPRRVVSNIGE